ncbi:zinc-dependent alcohol dehydrogenase family protein [Pseudophaeobacter leonis]|uniref:zinc-dependent alcohol dehydrogenase family protein n=1 Tax=Pseudophaeobacter leonis TaxID=1144477 RepID=UPI0009F62F92|nr:zinc-dependent alcohol dehydrogenase family protein [Pseudophaeobacter leonis]
MTTPTMQALMLDDYTTGAFRPARIIRPVPQAGEVLVRIKASGVNPIDYKIRTGEAPYAMPELPAVLGTDLAGVVEAVGDGVGEGAARFKPGDEVYGLTGGVRGLAGSLAEFAAVDADLLALKPRNISMREAAAIPLVALTAWEGLIDRADVQPGHKVLVQAGAGGVGHMAIQIARARGAQVFATARPRSLETLRELGATPIDITTTSVPGYVGQHTNGNGFDIVYDTVGGDILDASFEAVAHYGHVVSCAAFGQHSLATGSLRAATLSGVYVLLPMMSGSLRAHHGKILGEVASLVEAGHIKPRVDPRRFDLDSALAAHQAVEQGGASGKIVIDVAA